MKTLEVDKLEGILLRGGEDGIRTHARLASPSSFRNCPLQPLGYFSGGPYFITYLCFFEVIYAHSLDF